MNIDYFKPVSYYRKQKNRLRFLRMGAVACSLFLIGFWMVKPSQNQRVEAESVVLSGKFGVIEKLDEPISIPVPSLTVSVSPSPVVEKKVEVKVVDKVEEGSVNSIYRHTSAYGGKYGKEVLNKMLKECGSIHNVRVMVALSVPETQMGKNSHFGLNWWNYDRYNVNYQKDQDAIIHAVCVGLKGRYKNLVVNGKLNVGVGKVYNQSKDISNWISSIEWSYKKSGINY